MTTFQRLPYLLMICLFLVAGTTAAVASDSMSGAGYANIQPVELGPSTGWEDVEGSDGKVQQDVVNVLPDGTKVINGYRMKDDYTGQWFEAYYDSANKQFKLTDNGLAAWKRAKMRKQKRDGAGKGH